MIPLTNHRNRHILVDQSKIVQNALVETFLSADIASGSGTLTVANIEKFAVGKYVWINPFTERSEIIAVHASTAPSGTTITLAANTTYAHYTGDKVYYVEFNQVEISHASTLTGSKSTLATVALEAGSEILTYLDTTQTSGYYFARFKDSVATAFGGYSDGVIYDGWATNTVGYMIDRALNDVKKKLNTDVTLTDCLGWITSGLKLVQGKLRNWPEYAVYDYIVGQTARGTFVFTMPSDAYDTETPRSLLAIRVGTESKGLNILSPQEFDAQMNDVAYTQVRTEASANDTSLAVDNSYDFEDSGSLSVYVAGSKDSFTYTGVTRDDASGGTAAFTGIPSSGSDAIGQTTAVDTYVWQNETEGKPIWATVRNGNIEIWPLVDSDHDNQNVRIDYSTVATEANSEGDTIDLHRFDMIQSYLTWRIECKTKKDGMLDKNSGYYSDFKEQLNDAIRTLPVRKTKTAPNLNTMSKRTRPVRPDVQLLDVNDQ